MSATDAAYAIWVGLILVVGFGTVGLVGMLFLRGILGLWRAKFESKEQGRG